MKSPKGWRARGALGVFVASKNATREAKTERGNNLETIVRVHRRSLASLHQEIHGGLALLKRVDVRVKLILLGEVLLECVLIERLCLDYHAQSDRGAPSLARRERCWLQRW